MTIKSRYFIVLSVGIICAALIFLCVQPVWATEGKIVETDDKPSVIPVIYGIVCFAAFILAICTCLMRKRYIKLILLSVFVFICNMGYFAMSVSRTLEGALMANRLAYLGSVFLILFMLLIIMDICRVRYPKVVTVILVIISAVVFIIAASGGITDIYYREVNLVIIDGTAKLVKVYGSLHSAYYVYVFLYFFAMIGVILYAVLKKEAGVGKYAAFFAAAVFGNIGIWFSEQFLSEHFEFLSISYVVTEMLMLFMHSIMTENDDKAAMEPAGASRTFEDSPWMKTLTVREREVALLLLQDKRRKDIADELGITEHTVKKHTANIFSKLEVNSRKELIGKFQEN
ncbi:MAG: LuxR C-terminal-related transcriptional regulator [Lentihominibacter sp.]